MMGLITSLHVASLPLVISLMAVLVFSGAQSNRLLTHTDNTLALQEVEHEKQALAAVTESETKDDLQEATIIMSLYCDERGRSIARLANATEVEMRPARGQKRYMVMQSDKSNDMIDAIMDRNSSSSAARSGTIIADRHSNHVGDQRRNDDRGRRRSILQSTSVNPSPFQLCSGCRCCTSVDQKLCIQTACCFSIVCNDPKQPFGVCSLSPSSCNCMAC